MLPTLRMSLICIALSALPMLGQNAATHSIAGERWDKRFGGEMYLYGTQPVDFLRSSISKLPKGRALCLASGEGRNAVYLAEQGFRVTAMDASPKGLQKAVALADKHGVTISTEVGDLNNNYDMGVAKYDLITNFYYHNTAMLPDVMRALKPGGMFILQNFSIKQLQTNRFGPKNPAYLVKPNELLSLFPGNKILYYEDTVVELNEGMHQGAGAVVRLIVMKNPTPSG